MWTKGNVGRYTYTAKVYSKGSSYGINEGRISKLQINLGRLVVAAYERGWEKEPATLGAKEALETILNLYK